MNTTTNHSQIGIAASHRLTLWQPSRTGRAVTALVSVLLSTVLLTSIAVGMAWTGDASPALADRGALATRA